MTAAEIAALIRECEESRAMLNLVANDTTAADLAQEIEFLKTEHLTTVETLCDALREALGTLIHIEKTAYLSSYDREDIANDAGKVADIIRKVLAWVQP